MQSQVKFQIKSNKKKLTALFLLTLVFLLTGVFFVSHLVYGVTYFDQPKISSQKIILNKVAEPAVSNHPKQKSHAPEPSTFLLLIGGIGGVIVRFVRRSYDRFKRAFDILLSVLGLAMASPVLLLAGILIKLNSKGPMIYKQKRVGKNGEIFEIFKLRTMRVDAEKDTGAIWAKRNDPRITPVGKFLRNTHIDEIPQLINVLRGEMSIVGPRPERPEMVRDLKTVIMDYEKRLMVKPGITGLAQVWHKYDETIEDVKKKIKYDILYIRKMCLWVDLRIMAQTFVVVLLGKSAR